MCVYIYIYIYTHVYVYRVREKRVLSKFAPSLPLQLVLIGRGEGSRKVRIWNLNLLQVYRRLQLCTPQISHGMA